MSEALDQFMKVLGGEPLSLALCAMNLLLLYFLFKQGNQITQQRKETIEVFVNLQKETQTLLANCVSKDIMAIMIAALERDREAYRAMLPGFRSENNKEE